MPSTTNQPDDVLTVAEVATMLGVSSRTVERLKASGALPFRELGTRPRIYFTRADVMAYARGNRQTPAGS